MATARGSDVDAPPRVLIVDDHELFRGGLRDLLTEHGFAVAGEAPDGEAAVRQAVELAPDVAVVDLNMPGISGVEATARIRDKSPRTRILVLTVSAHDRDVHDAVLAGASGYLLKDSPPEQIVAGVQAAVEGESMLSPRVAAEILERLRGEESQARRGPTAALTDRESEVLRLMAAGKENPEIADELFISVQTVKNHVSSILAKLGVDNRVQAVASAMRHRLL